MPVTHKLIFIANRVTMLVTPVPIWTLKPWTNFSWQNKPWAEFSTLEVAACHVMHLLHSLAIWPYLELKTRPKQLLGSLPLDVTLPDEFCNPSTGSKVNKGFGKILSSREVWKIEFYVQTILMSVWGTKPLITVLWKHKSCLFSSHIFFMLLMMPSKRTTLLEEFCFQMSLVICLYY
jgi:hypothetical protein